ncbi:MAG TPA: bifunctional riboflavin kinase/FAD synthetase [bacterium]|nr:bifunctional riboflavin kinase/FAD synthetase [bacterium]
MEIKEFNSIPENFLDASAVTVGNFDGVHVGHRAIIGAVRGHARRLGAPSVLITFDPHPREVIFRGQQVPAIIPFKERTRLIAELGVDLLVKVNFTPEFAKRTAGEFVADVAAKLHPRAVVIGHDFRFGKDREGGENFLRDEGKEHGFELEVVAAVEVDGKPVSSSRIRGLIQAGEMRRVRRLLGAPFSLEGEVVAGHGRGKGMGFATANLKWEALLIPPDGVYAALAYWNGHCYPSVVNIGNNPTFGDQGVFIEAHIMDFSGDLYQKRLRIALCRRLRGEIKFSSVDALARQIKEDVKRAREELKEECGDGP